MLSMRSILFGALWLLLHAAAAPSTSWRVAAIELPPAIGPQAAQQGYYAVLLRRVLRELDAEPQFVFLPPQRAYQAAVAGDVDLALPFQRTPERDKVLWFTEPFYIASVRVFLRATDTWLPQASTDLRGRRGCTLLGAAAPPPLQVEVDADQVRLERVAQLDACFRLLQAQRVDFVVAGLNSGWLSAHTLPDRGVSVRMAPFVLAEQPVMLALPRVRPESEARVRRINAALRKLRAELKRIEAQVVPQQP